MCHEASNLTGDPLKECSMRNVWKLLLVTIGVGLAATAAIAQAPEESREGAPKTARNAGADKAAAVDAMVSRMMAFDKNKDDKLTRDEMTDSRMERMFDRADANHDGVVTKEELVAWATKLVADDAAQQRRARRHGSLGRRAVAVRRPASRARWTRLRRPWLRWLRRPIATRPDHVALDR